MTLAQHQQQLLVFLYDMGCLIIDLVPGVRGEPRSGVSDSPEMLPGVKITFFGAVVLAMHAAYNACTQRSRPSSEGFLRAVVVI